MKGFKMPRLPYAVQVGRLQAASFGLKAALIIKRVSFCFIYQM
jgi:hypothetical protein